MFGFGKVPEVVPLAVDGQQLTFASPTKYKIGKSAKIKLALVCLGKLQNPSLSLTVTAVNQRLDETYEVSGIIQADGKKLEELMRLLMYGGIKGACRRQSKRLEYSIRVLSRDLPSFRGVTINLNRSGADLQLHGPIAVGYDMNLGFDLELVGNPDVVIPAICVWSREDIDEKRRTVYRAGVRLGEGTVKALTLWNNFYQRLLDAEGASVMQKTIDGGEITERTEQGEFAATFHSVHADERVGPPVSTAFAPTSFSQAPKTPPVDIASDAITAATEKVDERLRIEYRESAVPGAHELGAGFASQGAMAAPQIHGRLQLPGSGDADGHQHLPPSLSPGPPASSGFQLPLGSSPSLSPGPPASSGFQLPLGSSPPISPVPPASSGFQLPLGSSPSLSPGPPASSGFQLPLGSSPPLSPGPPASSGFQLPLGSSPPLSPGPPASSGFQLPLGSSPPLSPGPPASSGFQLPLGSSPPLSPGPPASSGFQLPLGSPPVSSPKPAAGGGFQLPFSQPRSEGFSFSPPQSSRPENFSGASSQPELVQALSIRGATLTYRCRDSLDNVPGKQKVIQLAFEIGGGTTKVPVTVSLLEVDPDGESGTVCVATVLEDKEKVNVLNQLIINGA